MAVTSKCSLHAIQKGAILLSTGSLVVFPTETVYGLGADATNQEAVGSIYKVKGRPTGHPLIVHISDVLFLSKWARDVPEYAMKLSNIFWPGPMTLVLPRTELAKNFTTGGQDNVALRIPSHPVALELLKEFEKLGGLGVAAPSANRFGKVSPTTALAVKIELGEYLSNSDLILDGGTSKVGVESTIIDCTSELPVILRPGGVTAEMIQEALEVELDLGFAASKEIKVPGMLPSHYSPNAKIFLSGTPSPGDGFIALSHIPTPEKVIRLASPVNIKEYAQQLYSAFRLADSKRLKKVFVRPPTGKGLAIAVNDRLKKAAYDI